MDKLDNHITEDRLSDKDNYVLTHAVDIPELEGYVYIRVLANSALLQESWADRFLQANVIDAHSCVMDSLKDRLGNGCIN